MSGLSAWKAKMKAPDASAHPKQLEHAVKRQLAWASGTDFFADRDPVYHVSESFRQSFALLGMRTLGGSLYETRMEEGKNLLGGSEQGGEESERYVGAETLSSREREIADSRFQMKTSMDGVFSSAPGKGDFLRRFSETAFSRGALSGAVLRGTGRMMLVSCLKRTVGQSQPKNFRQRMLFDNASATRNVKGHPPDQVIVNKEDSDSAIGLAVDVVRDARRVVDSLKGLMENGYEGNPTGSGTLQKMYPFLSVTREQELLSRYRDMLRGFSGPEAEPKKQVIQRAEAKTQALIAKKRQMHAAFVHHLRALSDQAAVALRVFEQEDFRDLVYSALTAPPQPPAEPEDEGSTPEKEDE